MLEIMKKWDLQNTTKFDPKSFDVQKLINLLLQNRGIKTKKEVEEYLNPRIDSLTAESLDISEKDLQKAKARIEKAIRSKEQIVVFGDYDVDGVVGAAIIWESLNKLGANIMPYIPHRIEEGYGLSKLGIDNLLEKYPDTKIIITVDNGIVASEAVDYANSLGLQVIITDHHVPGESMPKAFAIVHSTKICGAAVGWFFTQQLTRESVSDHLGLVALATVTDVMQLSGFNRTLVMIGIKNLRTTIRPGLIELLKLAGVKQESLGVYELGHVIGPRLNAMGRIEHAMDSLRFICTPNLTRAKELAEKLHITNATRQALTTDGVLYAKKTLEDLSKKIIFISDKSYQPGIIGLVSGKLTEEYYRPSIVVSVGEEFSKGSARSVSGFNIIEFIRQFSDLLVDGGGHPMAAGFTVKTKDVKTLEKRMEERAEKEIDESLLIRKLKIDCELPLELITLVLFQNLSRLSPFGYGNPEPIFVAKSLTISSMRLVGADSRHLKIVLESERARFEGIIFGYDKSLDLKIGDKIDTVYNITVNEWNGNKKLELKIKDVARSISKKQKNS
jgi:single-stranded-DNA-specific exonuclease